MQKGILLQDIGFAQTSRLSYRSAKFYAKKFWIV